MPGNGIYGNSQVCKLELFPSLRINGNDFTAPASDQEHPVQTLHEDLEELHIWRPSQGAEHKTTSGNNTSASLLLTVKLSSLCPWVFNNKQITVTECSGFKDTVFVSSSVLRWSRHVEQDQLGPLWLVHHHLIQLYSRVHPPDVRLVPDGTKQ